MNIIEKIKYNWKSGLTVSLVSMPLSISLAVASGSTPAIGIITAIWAGLVASIFGGSNFNIIGPTGALSGLIATYVILHGSNSLAILTITTGIFVLIAYALKLEKYLIFIPSSVIHGFTLGVALIIGFNQFNAALGLYGLPKHSSFFQNLIEYAENIWDVLTADKESTESYEDTNQSLATHKINRILQILTILSVMASVLTLITDVLIFFERTNLERGLGLTSDGQLAIIFTSLMAILSLGMIYIFRKSRWL